MNKSREKTPTQGMLLFCFLADTASAEQNYRPNLFSILFSCLIFFFYRKSLTLLKHSTGSLESCEWISNTQKTLTFLVFPFLSIWDAMFLQSCLELSVGTDSCFGKVAYKSWVQSDQDWCESTPVHFRIVLVKEGIRWVGKMDIVCR